MAATWDDIINYHRKNKAVQSAVNDQKLNRTPTMLPALPPVMGGSADSFYGRTGGSGNSPSGQMPPPKRTVPTLPQLQRNVSPSMPQPVLPRPKQAAPYRPAAPIRPQPKIPYNSMPAPVPVGRINEAVPLERRQQYAQRQADIERQRKEAWAAYNAAMAELARTDLKAHRDAIYDRAMMLSQGGRGTLPKTPEHIRQLYSQAQRADALTKTEALARGFENGFFLNLNDAKSATGENLTRVSQQENPLGFLAGNIAGTMVTQSKLYGMVNGALGKVAPGAVQAAGSIADPILRKAAQVGLNLAGQQAADTIIRTPQVIIRGIQEGKTFADIAKDVGWQQTEDFLFNLAFVGLDEFAKHFFSGSVSAAAADALEPAKSRYFQGVTSPEELHAAYRRQAKTLHPDMGGSDAAFIEMADEAKKVAQWLERNPAAPVKPPAGEAGPKSEPAYVTDGIGENRPGIWRNAEFDQPVTVIGYAGSYGGRDYVRIAQSQAAVPLDEISLFPLGPGYAAGRAVRTPQGGGLTKAEGNGQAAGQTATGPRLPYAPGYDQKQYIQQISDVMNARISPRQMVVVGDTPEILLKHGANQRKLTLNQSDIRKIAYPPGYMGGLHNLGFYALEQLPAQLKNPVAILKSSTQPNSLVVFTELLDGQGNPVMVPIHLDKEGRIGLSNHIASMYGRGNYENFINTERQAGRVLYEKESRALQQLPSSGLQLSGVKATADPIFNLNVPQGSTEVNTHSAQTGANHSATGNALQLRMQAQEFYKAAQRKQLELMGGLTQALMGLDAQLVSGGAKSVDSMLEKVLRKQGPAEGYGLASMKDHSRAAVLLKGFEDVPAAIEALKKRFPQMTGEAFLDVPLNRTGYRGIHLTVPMGNGVNAEIQISTPEAWAIKKQTDAIYDKWRNLDFESLSIEQLAQQQRDYDRSKHLWEHYYAGITPEVRRSASSSVIGLASQSKPQRPLNGSQRLDLNSNALDILSSGNANSRLSSVTENVNISTPPNAQSTPGAPGYPDTLSIARPNKNSNSRGPYGTNTVGAAQSVYSVRRDARINARQAVKESMADGYDLDALIAAERDVARYEKEIALYNQKQAHAEARLLQRARKADREDRTALLNLARKMNKLKTSPENRALIDALLDGVDTTSKGIRDSTVAKLVELRETYSKAQLDPDFLPVKDIENKLTRLENTKINDLEIEDVRDMLDVLKGIRHRVETQKQLIGKERARKVHDAAQGVISEVKASKGSREKITGIKKSVKTLYTVEALRPKTFFERLGGWEDGETAGLYRDLEAGQTKMVRFQMEATKKFQPFVSEHRKLMERWSGPKAKLIDTGILAPNGMRLMITPAQRISLYLHSLNPSNMRHIVNGGITAPHPLLYHKGNLADAYGRGTTIKLTPSQIKMITDGMTAEETEFADLAHGFFNEDSKKAINETSLLLDGYEKAGVRDYFPIHSNQNFVSGNIEGLVRDGTIEGMGMLKERRESSAPIVLEDVTNVLTRQIDNVSKYYGLAIPIRNFGAVYKAVTPGFGESVKNAITQKWGKEATAYIDNLLTDLQGGRIQRSGVFSRGLSKARSNFAQAALSVNPGVTMKQAASYPTAAATLGWRALLEGLANGKVDHDLIDRYTPLLWNRRQGMSTVELGDMAKGRSWAQKAPALMGWIQAADVMTVGRIWKASEAYVKNHYKDLEPGSDAFYKQVARWFDRAVLDTQPNYTPLQRPDLLRSDNELVKAVTMFQTQRMQNYNMMYEAAAKLEDAVRSGSKEKIKAAGREFSSITSALVVAGLTLALMNLANYTVQGRLQNYEDKDGNLSPGGVAGGLGKDFAAAMAGNLPLGNELYNLLNSSFTEDKWYGVEVPQVAAISDFAGNLAELSKAIGEAKGITENLLENGEGRMAIPKSVNTLAGPMRKTALSVATLCGVPASNVEKYLVGILGNFFPEFKARYDNNFYPKTLQNARNDAERSVALDNRVKLPDEAKEEVLRLGVYPAENKTYFTLDGERYDLSPSQQVQYDKVYDQTVTETLDALVKNKQFLRLDDENREKILRNLFEYATALSRESVSSYSLPKEFQKVRDAKALGIQPWKYMLIKNAISGIKEPLQQSMTILEYPGLTDRQKKWLGDNLINYGFFIPQEKDVDYSSRESVIITSMSEAAQRHWPEVKDKLTAEKYQKYYGILTQTGKKKEAKLKEAVAAGMTKSGAEWLWKIINSK